MRAVYLAIILGFLRRLLRRVLVPTGKYLHRHGGYVLCMTVKEDGVLNNYGIVCFGRNARAKDILADACGECHGVLPGYCMLDIVVGRLADMRTWQEIGDDFARYAACEISKWWTRNGRKYL